MKISKRRRGNEEYFYLQHSFRKKGKVVTREIYLGKTIPANIDEIKIKLEHESREALYEKLEKIKKQFQREWGRIPGSARDREKEEIAIAFTYNTNAIEGSTITLSESREIIQDKIAPNKPLGDIKETEAHAKVFLNTLNKKEKMTKELFLKWHQEVFGETKSDISGKFRRYLVRVGNYIAPNWQDIDKLMEQLIKFIKEESKMNPVEVAARAHYRFERIHPFGDGNGRVGRLLMNHILWHNNYPMLIIEYKKRISYYKALQKGEEGFVKYFIGRFLAVHKKRYLSEK